MNLRVPYLDRTDFPVKTSLMNDKVTFSKYDDRTSMKYVGIKSNRNVERQYVVKDDRQYDVLK